MMIKSWHKYNELSQELTRDMILDIIYYRNFTLLSFDEDLSKEIDRFINRDLEAFIDFSSEDTTFINREEYREAQSQIDRIYQVCLDQPEIRNKLILIYNRVKSHMGKTGFSDYEDFLVEYLDDGYDIEFLFKPGDSMEIEIKKVGDNFTEHIQLLSRVASTVKRMAKFINIPISAIYIKDADYSKDGNYIESHVKIIIL